MDNSLEVVVPSRRRPGNMRRILALLPEALVCVDEREVNDYRPVVPGKQLVPHPPTTNLSQVRNWIIDNVSGRCLVQVDDDLKRVYVSDGSSQRPTVDPDEIMQILVNTANICEDVGIGVFAFARQRNPALVHQDQRPFRLVHPVSCTFGMLGAARYRTFDERFIGRDDFDWTMRTLIEDRILFADNRFYFDHGPIFAGRGGNVGLVDQSSFDEASRLLKRLYGRAIEVSRVREGQRTKHAQPAMTIRLERKQTTAYR